MIPLTEDIEILTAGYLSALKSNSDEIVRLADALRAAEAERNTATAELVETRLALMNAEACRAEAEKQANTARDERDALRINLNNARQGWADTKDQLDTAREDADIAAHRAETPDPTVSQGQMTTDSARPHVIADPAQAHAAELIDVLARQFDTLAVEARVDAMRFAEGWAATHTAGQASAFEKAFTMTRALLATLERERKAQKAVTP